MVKRIIQLVLFILIWGVLCFASAGTLDWLRAWIYLTLLVAGFTVSALVVFKTNPQLIDERGKMHADTKLFDKTIIAIYTLLLFTTPVIAGFDAVRFGWSSIPIASVYVGTILYVVSLVPPVWAMAVNPYLETGVRIQQDRG